MEHIHKRRSAAEPFCPVLLAGHQRSQIETTLRPAIHQTRPRLRRSAARGIFWWNALLSWRGEGRNPRPLRSIIETPKWDLDGRRCHSSCTVARPGALVGGRSTHHGTWLATGPRDTTDGHLKRIRLLRGALSASVSPETCHIPGTKRTSCRDPTSDDSRPTDARTPCAWERRPLHTTLSPFLSPLPRRGREPATKA